MTQRRVIWCYLFLPVSSCLFLRSRDANVRFHAWQALYLGMLYVMALTLVTSVEVGVGLVNRHLGQMVNEVGPLIFMTTLLLWLGCVMRIVWKGSCRLPLFGRWAERKVG